MHHSGVAHQPETISLCLLCLFHRCSCITPCLTMSRTCSGLSRNHNIQLWRSWTDRFLTPGLLLVTATIKPNLQFLFLCVHAILPPFLLNTTPCFFVLHQSHTSCLLWCCHLTARRLGVWISESLRNNLMFVCTLQLFSPPSINMHVEQTTEWRGIE